MKIENIIDLCVNWGYWVKLSEHEGFIFYMEEMLKRGRVLMLYENNTPIGMVTFFITNDYDSLYKKDIWDTPNEDQKGHQVYVDKMICKHMTLKMRRDIQELIENNFPLVTEAHYHREPKDRHVMIKRRCYEKVHCENTKR